MTGGSPPSGAARAGGEPRLELHFADRVLPLREGTLTIGRGFACEVVIEDALASRKHARITTDASGSTIEDLGSVNGTCVNGVRVHEPQRLSVGDWLTVGAVGMRVVASGTAASPTAGARADRPAVSSEPEPTARPTDSFQLFAEIAERALAAGETQHAVYLLSAQVGAIVEMARRGGAASPEATDFVVRYAIKLAQMTGQGAWIDGMITVFTRLASPLPLTVLDQLEINLHRLPALDLATFRGYVDTLRATAGQFSSSELLRVHRLTALEQTVSRR
jgi:hypothetical protein